MNANADTGSAAGWYAQTTSSLAELPAWKRSLLAFAGLLLGGGLAARGVEELLGVSSARAGGDGATLARASSSPSGAGGSEAAGGGSSESQNVGRGDPGGPVRSGSPSAERLALRGFGPGEIPRGSGEAGPEGSGEDPLLALRPSPRDRPGSGDLPASGGTTEARELLPSPREPPAGTGGEESSRSRWSPTLVRGGFSFFVAFAIGFALRAFARLSLLVCGMTFLVVAGFAYLGFLEVHWDRIEDRFHAVVGALRTESSSFRTFLQGSLPSGVMGGLGLLAGLKKR